MDFGFLLLAVFLIYVVAGKKQDARRRKRSASIPSQSQSKRAKPTVAKTAAKGAKEVAFDVEGFRARLRMAWGEKEREEETARPRQEGTETPASLRVTVSSTQARPVSSSLRAMGAAETEQARLRAEAAREMKKGAPPKIEPVGAFDGESASEAMRRWVRYDAVLGKPRSRRKWQSPVRTSC